MNSNQAILRKEMHRKILANFKEKDPKERKLASDAVVEILKNAKMRVEATGLGELMECLKGGIKDANKAVLRGNI